MGRPDQGTKAQTPVGYSHGTGVSTSGPVTTVAGVHSRVNLGVGGFCWCPCARAARVGWQVAQRNGQRVGPGQHPQRRGMCEVLPTGNDGCDPRGVKTARGPREEINEGAKPSPGPGTTSRACKDHLRAQRSLWWECWGTHGGIGDNMVGVLGDAWRYWGRYGGSIGGRMAVLGKVCWEYWGTYGSAGDSVMEVLGDTWRYWGVPLTPGTTQRGYWGIPWPLKQTRGTMPAGVYIA